jgi:N-glycosylase/DNA lyase
MEFTGLIKNISNDYITGDMTITFSVNEKALILPEHERLKNVKKLRITAVQYREKRSLDANAYAWQLMTKIAEALRTSKEEVYEIMLKRYGTIATDDEGNIITISVPAKVDILTSLRTLSETPRTPASAIPRPRESS